MKRSLLSSLLTWKTSQTRKPILLRGARQVGKTHLVRELGNHFQHFVEINFEEQPEAKRLFASSLSPQELVRSIELFSSSSVIPERTLLFFDEIQECPEALKALRYFYEKMPELHVIGAGSLLEFQIQRHGVPVGRVSFLYLYPLSFLEFLDALGEEKISQFLREEPLEASVPDAIHRKILDYVKLYYVLGGMPEVVSAYVHGSNLFSSQTLQSQLLNTYRQDFTTGIVRHEHQMQKLITFSKREMR